MGNLRLVLSSLLTLVALGVVLSCGGDGAPPEDRLSEGRTEERAATQTRAEAIPDTDTDAIESVVRDLHDALLDGDLRKLEGTLSSDIDPNVRSLLLEALSTAQEVSEERRDHVRIDQMFVRTQGDTVEVDIVYKAGSPDTMTLVLEDGRWRIIDIESLSQGR